MPRPRLHLALPKADHEHREIIIEAGYDASGKLCGVSMCSACTTPDEVSELRGHLAYVEEMRAGVGSIVPVPLRRRVHRVRPSPELDPEPIVAETAGNGEGYRRGGIDGVVEEEAGGEDRYTMSQGAHGDGEATRFNPPNLPLPPPPSTITSAYQPASGPFSSTAAPGYSAPYSPYRSAYYRSNEPAEPPPLRHPSLPFSQPRYQAYAPINLPGPSNTDDYPTYARPPSATTAPVANYTAAGPIASATRPSTCLCLSGTTLPSFATPLAPYGNHGHVWPTYAEEFERRTRPVLSIDRMEGMTVSCGAVDMGAGRGANRRAYLRELLRGAEQELAGLEGH